MKRKLWNILKAVRQARNTADIVIWFLTKQAKGEKITKDQAAQKIKELLALFNVHITYS